MIVTSHNEVFSALCATDMQFSQLVRQLADVIPGLEANSFLEKSRQISSRASRPFLLGIMGEFRSGKSTLINALVERDVALVDEIETTATLNHYCYAESEHASIAYNNGETESFSLQQLHDVLDTNRYNTEWLEDLKNAEVTVSLPIPYLKRMELWDSPGFGGNEFNEQTASAFLERVDAVVWVFNRNMLGKAALLPALGELRRRGKHIIGVINKCELDSESDIQRFEDEIRRRYGSIPFAAIVAISTKMAREQQMSPTPESPYPGDLPLDGGISGLQEVLELQVAGKEQQETLAASAAAGDLAATVQTLTDLVRSHLCDAKRQLYLLEHQSQEYPKSVAERFGALANELSDDYVYQLRRHLRQAFEERIDQAADSELRERDWYKSTRESLCSEESLGGFSIDFCRGLVDRLRQVVAEIDSGVWERLNTSLTPAEREVFAGLIRVDDGVFDSQALAVDTSNTADGAFAGAAIGAVAGIVAAIIIPGGQFFLPFVTGAAGAVWGAISETSVGTRDLTREELAQRLSSRATQDIEYLLERIRPKVRERWFVPQLDKIREQIIPVLLTEQRAVILQNADESAVRRVVAACEPGISQLEAMVERLHAFTEAVPPDPDIVECCIRPNDRDRAQRVIQAVFGEATTQLAVVDGQLAPDAIPCLLMAPKDTPISILTWDSPLSSIKYPDFREQVVDLRNRGYSVSVLSPRRRDNVDVEELPEGCWIFTDRGSYHLSRSLGVLLNGEAEVEFVPHDDAGELRTKNFERWWKDRVPGYSVVKSV